jgi:carbonic anhydrase
MTAAIDRRLLFGLLGAGAAGFAGAGRVLAAGGTDALLLNCIDYRLTGATTHYMDQAGMAGKYDQVVLAGAALGAHNKKFPDWGRTFWDHVQIAIDLHHIHQVIVIDHRDCGAYKVILGEDLARDPKREFEVHARVMRALRAEIAHRHPKLQVQLGLMALDGKVETVG